MITNFLIGKILMTVSTVVYGFFPPFFDLNKTHAVNPLWPGHARFHIVWQVMITFCISVLSLYFLWGQNPEFENIAVPFFIGLAVLGSFFINIFLMKLYQGSLADDNGVPKTFTINSNVLVFSMALLLLIVGFMMTFL